MNSVLTSLKAGFVAALSDEARFGEHFSVFVELIYEKACVEMKDTAPLFAEHASFGYPAPDSGHPFWTWNPPPFDTQEEEDTRRARWEDLKRQWTSAVAALAASGEAPVWPTQR